jgi:O-antigen/teichoic acid export membrane protein
VAFLTGGLARLLRSDIWRHGSLVFVAILVLNVANYVFYALAGRALPVGEYGEFMSLVALTIIATAPALVAQNALSKLIADVAAAGDQAPVAGIARATQRFALAVSAALFVLAIVLRGPLAVLVHATDPLLVPLAAAAAVVAFVVPLQRGIFQGAGRFGDLAASMLIEGTARIAIVVPLARAAGVRGALGALLLSLLVPAGTSALRFRMLWPLVARRTLDLRRAWLAALGTGAGFLALIVMLYFDVILVRHYFAPEIAGLYSGVSLVGRAVYTAVAFVPMIAIPKIVARRASGASARPVALLGVAVALAAAAGAVGIVAFAPGRVIAAVGGAPFRPAAPLLLPYAFAASALAAANVAVAVRVGLHRFGHVAPLVTIALAEIVTVVLRHARITDVLWTIVIGHSAGLLSTLVVTALERGPRRADQELSRSALTVTLRNK